MCVKQGKFQEAFTFALGLMFLIELPLIYMKIGTRHQTIWACCLRKYQSDEMGAIEKRGGLTSQKILQEIRNYLHWFVSGQQAWNKFITGLK